MIKDKECTVFLTLAGSTSAAGCMDIYRDMVKYKMVDAIVATPLRPQEDKKARFIRKGNKDKLSINSAEGQKNRNTNSQQDKQKNKQESKTLTTIDILYLIRLSVQGLFAQ